MSDKRSILLTKNNEHWYFEPDGNKDVIVFEFNKEHKIETLEDKISITVKQNTKLYKQILNTIHRKVWKESK